MTLIDGKGIDVLDILILDAGQEVLPWQSLVPLLTLGWTRKGSSAPRVPP